MFKKFVYWLKSLFVRTKRAKRTADDVVGGGGRPKDPPKPN